MKTYKNAFKCKKCPQSNSENGCPFWWEIPWENDKTNEIKIQKGCIFSQDIGLPILQTLVRSVHINTQYMSAMRNSFINFTNEIQMLDHKKNTNNNLELPENNKNRQGE